MRKVCEIKGKKFGRLLVLRRTTNRGKRVFWKCICDCGNKVFVRSENLRYGLSKSCGCLQKEIIAKMGKENFTHKMCGTQFYKKFRGILRRCNNKNDPNYKNYGAKNLKCLWKSFEDFKNDMFESYIEHYKKFGEKQTTIDRIDNNGNYSKENCRWATPQEQNLNYSRNHLITYKGKKQTIFEWAKEMNLKYATLYMRLTKYNWSVKKSLTTPPHQRILE